MFSAMTVLTLRCLTLGSPRVDAGGWVQKEGGCYLKLSGAYLSATEEFIFSRPP